MKLGVLGLTPGNGHPYSFSAILNGYSDEGFQRSDWGGIHTYLRAKDPADFGIGGARVTHAWTQDPAETRKLCDASLIPHACAEPAEMLGKVDALLLNRSDEENHLAMALPFLEKGIPVFIDKPLALNPEHLRAFRPWLEAGKLMSCSGMLYAREVDDIRNTIPEFGEIKLVRAAVVLEWAHYGVHMVDAILHLGLARPVSVTALPARHDAFVIALEDGTLVQVDALGTCAKNFKLEVYGAKKDASVQLFDNFHAFRRTLTHFLRMVETGRPQLPPERTLTSMKILIAGLKSRAEQRTVMIDETAL